MDQMNTLKFTFPELRTGGIVKHGAISTAHAGLESSTRGEVEEELQTERELQLHC
jgi:hypothetical protein